MSGEEEGISFFNITVSASLRSRFYWVCAQNDISRDVQETNFRESAMSLSYSMARSVSPIASGGASDDY